MRMPLVQQEQLSSQTRLGDMIFGSPSVEQWPRSDRPAEASTADRVPVAVPSPQEQPIIQQKDRARRRRAARISLYELFGQTLALLGTLAIAGLIWAIGAYFTLHFLDTWGAQQKLGLLLTTFGMTPSPVMLYWMTRSVPLVMTVIEAFLLPRWNWPWTPAAEQVIPSGKYRWLIFGAILTPDVYTTAAGLATWVFETFSWTAGWSIAAAAVLGFMIAISPEKIARRVLVDLKMLWTPLAKQGWHIITQR